MVTQPRLKLRARPSTPPNFAGLPSVPAKVAMRSISVHANSKIFAASDLSTCQRSRPPERPSPLGVVRPFPRPLHSQRAKQYSHPTPPVKPRNRPTTYP